MEIKDFRILEIREVFYVQRKQTKTIIIKKGYFFNRKKTTETKIEWKKVGYYGEIPFYFRGTGYLTEHRDYFKSLEKAEKFIIKVCKKPIYHYLN